MMDINEEFNQNYNNFWFERKCGDKYNFMIDAFDWG
jgi:hypothetical protein